MNLSADLNFRNYLQSELDRRMTLNSLYSMRAFARDLKMPVSRLSEFLSGKSGISLVRVEEITQRLKLSDHEAQFVKDIAAIEFSRNKKIKEMALQRVSTLRKDTLSMSALDFEEISDWYYFAILEMISKTQVLAKTELLAQKIGIKENVCQLAIERLKRKDLICEKEGYWKTTNKSLSVVGEPKEAIQKFHRQFVAESVKAFQNCEFIEREFSSTFAMLSENEIQALRKKINQTVEATFKEINEHRNHFPEENPKYKLYGLGVQLFPVQIPQNNFLNLNENSKEIL